MAIDPKTVAFIVDQASGAGNVPAKLMLGGYGINCNDRIVAMVFDDRLFVKPTAVGCAFAPELLPRSAEAGPSDRHWVGSDWLPRAS